MFKFKFKFKRQLCHTCCIVQHICWTKGLGPLQSIFTITPLAGTSVVVMTDPQARSKVNPAFGHLRLVDYLVIVYCIIWILGEINLELGAHLQAFNIQSSMTTRSMGTFSTYLYISFRVSLSEIELIRNQHPTPSCTNVRIIAQCPSVR